MEFSFHYSTTHESVDHYGGIGTTLPGVDTSLATGGYDGKISVDVLSLGPNDTLVLSILQDVPLYHSLDAAPSQVLAYPTGQVDIPPGTVQLRPPELNLARFLGRKFINGDYLDEKNHWRIDMTLPGNTAVATDFTITKNTNGILDITEAQTVTTGMDKTHTAGRLTYDMNRAVPISLHEDPLGTLGNAVHDIYDYTLTADSLATTKP